MPAFAVSHTIIAIVMVANGTIGAKLHVPFPVLNRSTFGFWFNYFNIISCVILSMFWFGVQTFVGSVMEIISYVPLSSALFVRIW